MTGNDEPTDRELLAATASGSAAAFDRFVARHRAAVFRYARAHAGDHDAEDVLQQTFLAAWQHAGTATAERGAKPWLLTIARNALARMRRRPAGDSAAPASIEDLGEAAGFADPAATPERFAAAAEERGALAAAMAALLPLERDVIHLRDIEELTGDEVAELLGLSLPAMKSRLHRARLRLVAELRTRLPEATNR